MYLNYVIISQCTRVVLETHFLNFTNFTTGIYLYYTYELQFYHNY